MKIQKLSRKTSFSLVLTVIFLALGFTPAFGLNNSLTIESNGQTMAEVAGEISRQLNYKVVMDEDLTKKKLSGKFTNVTLDDFLARIFRGTNVILLYDDIENQVTISSFGTKSRMIEYDQTTDDNWMNSDSDSLELEIEPGVILREVVFHANNTNSLDNEIEPGIKISDATVNENNLSPTDYEIEPGIKIPSITSSEDGLQELEIEPGVNVPEVIADITDLQELEIEPGIKLSNAIFN